jgi:DNA-binding LacI/PurR family transcriptional regulator
LRVSIRDIARDLNLSRQAVSAALNGTSGTSKVSPATAERVLAHARSLNYRPSLAAKAMRTKSLRQIGIIMDSDYGSRRHAPLLQMDAALGLGTCLQAHGWNLNIIEDKGARSPDMPLPSYLREHSLDGVVNCSTSEERERVLRQDLQRFGIPCIHLNSPGEYNSVTLDDRLGAELATRHLIERGHSRILFVGPESIHHSLSERLAGFRDTMQTAGLHPESHILKSGDIARLDYEERLTGLRNMADEFVAKTLPALKPTALFCYDDTLAMRLLRPLNAAGLRVPQDISLVGFNDSAYMDLLDPALTTVRADFYQMGVVAGEMLLKLMAKPKCRIPSKMVTPTLVVRDSTALPPAEITRNPKPTKIQNP